MMQVILIPEKPSYLSPATRATQAAMKTPNTLEPTTLHELDSEQIREILRNHYVGSLAFISHRHPYVLPITYYYDEPANCLISYSMEGQKIEAMRKNPAVSLGVYEMESPMQWKSVLVHGRFEELHQIDAKAYLHRFTEGIRKKIDPKGSRAHTCIEDFSSRAHTLGIPLVYRIKIADWTGMYRKG